MELLTTLQSTRDRTLRYFDLSLAVLSKTYAPGKWTVQELLVHLADAEMVLLERIKRVIAEPKQVVWAFDQDRWCMALDYKNSPLSLSQALYLAARSNTIYLAERYYEPYGHQQFVHSETGIRTLRDEFDKVVWHNQNHFQQIATALNN